jgi:MraZ protein
MFIGTYEHNIDEKYRITLPAKFREQLIDGAYILRGFDKNLVVMSVERFNTLSKKVTSLSFGDPKARKLSHFIHENAGEVEFDKNGRFILPPNLRAVAQLDSEATVVGAGENIEIWSPALLKEHDACFDEPNAIAELASEYDLSF